MAETKEYIKGDKNVFQKGSCQIKFVQNNFGQEQGEWQRAEVEEFDVDEQTETVKPSKSADKPISQPKIVKSTFRYVFWEKDCKPVTDLYLALRRAKWIAEDTEPDSFTSIFEGEETDATVRWIGTQQHLWYLFKLLMEKGYIFIPEPTPQQPWVIVQSHFVRKDRRLFSDWNKQKEPKRYAKVVEKLADILDPNSPLR